MHQNAPYYFHHSMGMLLNFSLKGHGRLKVIVQKHTDTADRPLYPATNVVDML